MQKKVLNGILLALFGILFYTACTSDVIETPAPPVITDTISFSQEIQPGFNQNCISCHRPGGTSPDLTAANSYNSLINGNLVDTLNPEQSELYLRLLPSGPSHPVKDPDFANIILNWIRQGAIDN